MDRNVLAITVFKARCTPEKLTILTKHSKIIFFQPCCKEYCYLSTPEIVFKMDECKGFQRRFCDMVSQCAEISVAFTCVLANVQVKLL